MRGKWPYVKLKKANFLRIIKRVWVVKISKIHFEKFRSFWDYLDILFLPKTFPEQSRFFQNCWAYSRNILMLLMGNNQICFKLQEQMLDVSEIFSKKLLQNISENLLRYFRIFSNLYNYFFLYQYSFLIIQEISKSLDYSTNLVRK